MFLIWLLSVSYTSRPRVILLFYFLAIIITATTTAIVVSEIELIDFHNMLSFMLFDLILIIVR